MFFDLATILTKVSSSTWLKKMMFFGALAGICSSSGFALKMTIFPWMSFACLMIMSSKIVRCGSGPDNGTILKQSRPKGYTIKEGTKLTITVADNTIEPEEECNPLEGDICDTVDESTDESLE